MRLIRFSPAVARSFGTTLVSAVGAVILLGCAASPRGDESSAYDSAMSQQNTAIRSVQVFKGVPDGAVGVRLVMAAACGSDVNDTGSDENFILTGLKLKAYKSGANGLAEINIKKMRAQSDHCAVGFSVGGTAKAFTVAQ